MSGGPGAYGRGGRGGPAGRLFGPKVKPKNLGATLGRLGAFFAKEAGLLGAVLALVAVDAVLGLTSPFLVGRAVDTLAGADAVKSGLLALLVLILLSTQAVDALVNVAQGWLQAGMTRRIVQNLRRTLFAKLQRLPVSFFDRHTHGDLMSRLTNDIDNVSSTIGQSTASLLSSLLIIGGSLVLMQIGRAHV